MVLLLLNWLPPKNWWPHTHAGIERRVGGVVSVLVSVVQAHRWGNCLEIAAPPGN
jgi:hypothetical protein